jgi:oxygen-dependent protoporphyrinogen oxidase
MHRSLARSSLVLVAVCSVLCSTTAFVPTAFRGTVSPIQALRATETDVSEVDCIVVGGGISGSTLAHNIHHQSDGLVSVLLTEARDYIGGNVKSHRTDDGFLWEEGPNSFAAASSIIRISHELGIDDQLVFADESLPPWVNHNGKLHPLPKGQGGKGPKGQIELVFGPNGVLKFALAGELLSWPGKIRAGIGAFVGHLPAPEGKDETIREWVTRILGEEVFLRCIDPFVSGVYAGNPETLSMQAALSKINRIETYSYGLEWNKCGALFYGGLARQVELTKERKADPPDPAWVEFEYGNPGSYREGLSTLPNAIAENLGDKIKTEWKLITIEKAPENDSGYKYVATYETPDGIKKVQAKSIVSTLPTHALTGSVLENVMPEAKELFNTIRSKILRKGIYHPPVVAVTVAYPKSSFKDVELANGFGNLQDLPGFGSLNPRTEGTRTLGTLWSSSLFPGRCPEDYNLLLNYIGGSRDVSLAGLSDEEIIGEVDKGCREVLLKPDAPGPKVIGMKIWPTAIPQYELGHLELMAKLDTLEKKVDGLWICGNYRTGVAFPDCVTFGYEHAKVVIDHLKPVAVAPVNAEVEVEAPVAVAPVDAEVAVEAPVAVVAPVDAEAEAEAAVEAAVAVAPVDAEAEVAVALANAEAAVEAAVAPVDAEAEVAVALANAEAAVEAAVAVAPVDAEAAAELVKSKQPVDISIPYDAAAKLGYEASDKSMAYADFKTKFEAEAVELVKSKQPVDISIPYDEAPVVAVAPVVAEAAVEEPVAVAPVTVAPVDADVTIGPPREY